MEHDAAGAGDREVYQFLLTNHKAITRTVRMLPNGIETLTESDQPEVAQRIQQHVPAMYERLKSNSPVRSWDPLFAEVFRHGQRMTMVVSNTARGVRVIETSPEPEVVKLIQAHAEVVSLFVQHGHDEARKEHPVPPGIVR